MELIAAASAPASDITIEVSDADAAWKIVQKHNVKVLLEIGDTAYGARIFAVEVSGLRLAFITYATSEATTSRVRCRLRANISPSWWRGSQFFHHQSTARRSAAGAAAGGCVERRHHSRAGAGII